MYFSILQFGKGVSQFSGLVLSFLPYMATAWPTYIQGALHADTI